MDTQQAKRLADLLVARRVAAGLSTSEVARRAHVNKATVSHLERGNASPKAGTLQAIGEVLGIPASDLFAIAGWVTPKELPTIRPYLRTKYRRLPADAVREIEDHFAAIAQKHGISFDPDSGPLDGEDE